MTKWQSLGKISVEEISLDATFFLASNVHHVLHEFTFDFWKDNQRDFQNGDGPSTSICSLFPRERTFNVKFWYKQARRFCRNSDRPSNRKRKIQSQAVGKSNANANAYIMIIQYQSKYIHEQRIGISPIDGRREETRRNELSIDALPLRMHTMSPEILWAWETGCGSTQNWRSIERHAQALDFCNQDTFPTMQRTSD